MDEQADDGRSQWWAVAAAVILSGATLASAWSGYEASRWAGEATMANRSATVARFDATAALASADAQRITDVEEFGAWLSAEVQGDESLAGVIRDRFSPSLAPAFDAWLGSADVEDLPTGSPFDSESYVLPGQQDAARLLEEAEQHALRADDASGLSTDYVLVAVLYASVLFLAGIASKLRDSRVAHVMVVLAGVVFVVAAVAMLSLPVMLGF